MLRSPTRDFPVSIVVSPARSEVPAQPAHLGLYFPDRVVFLRHHRNGVGNRAKAGHRSGSSVGTGALGLCDKRKKNHLFLGQMQGQLGVQLSQQRLQFRQLSAVFAVAANDLLRQLGQPWQLTFYVSVMRSDDVRGQLFHRPLPPIHRGWRGPNGSGFQSGQHRVDFDIAGCAGFRERFAPSAAIVNSKALKDAH
jgi:hypothetical protein